MNSSFSRTTGLGLNDLAVSVAPGASISSVLNALPPFLAGNVTITLAGTRVAPATYAEAVTVPRAPFVTGKRLTLRAEDSAASAPIPLAGGDTSARLFVVLAKASLGWSAGDWAGASLVCLSHDESNSNAGQHRTVDGVGARSCQTNGTLDEGGGYWRLDVTAAWPQNPTNKMIVIFHACTLAGNLSVSAPSADYILIENIGIKGRLRVERLSSVMPKAATIFGSATYGLYNYGRVVALDGVSTAFHVCGNTYSGVRLVEGATIQMALSDANRGYISGNGSYGVEIGSASQPGGLAEFNAVVFDRNGSYAIQNQSGFVSVKNSFGLGSGDQLKLNVVNASGAYTAGNTTLTEVASNNGAIE